MTYSYFLRNLFRGRIRYCSTRMPEFLMSLSIFNRLAFPLRDTFRSEHSFPSKCCHGSTSEQRYITVRWFSEEILPGFQLLNRDEPRIQKISLRKHEREWCKVLRWKKKKKKKTAISSEYLGPRSNFHSLEIFYSVIILRVPAVNSRISRIGFVVSRLTFKSSYDVSLDMQSPTEWRIHRRNWFTLHIRENEDGEAA